MLVVATYTATFLPVNRGFKMSDGVVIENNTKEEVAYKLMNKIIGTGQKDKEDVLNTYYECLMVVKGNHPSDVLED
ncbi:hypothetical protein [Vibrio cholerae]|uniref:hypothetical protein n=1 Tax=Vibrio cholerae TaxID=666 RepID=UPI001E306BA1|nr:hypothetical protein [Vibrio cholerae]